MAWIQSEINQPQVFITKYSELQAVISDNIGERRSIEILSSVQTETWLDKMVDESANHVLI